MKMERIKTIGVFLIAFGVNFVSYSQNPTKIQEGDSTKKKVPSFVPKDVQLLESKNEPLDGQVDEEKPKVTLSGYIDSYVLHAFNNPKSGTLMGNPSVYGGAPAGRAFDRLNDQFSLGLVQTKFTYSDKKSDLVIDLTFGPNAELGNFGNTRTTTLWTSPNNYQSQMIGTSAAIKQAYFTYKATDKLSFTAGQFGTHIGYEVIDAPINYHYSLSNLFNNGPFYHIGVKANYALTDKIMIMAGLVNNWDNLFDNNSQKSAIAQVFVNPVKGLNIYLNYIGGYSDDTYLSTLATSSGKAFLENYTRQLFDLTTGYQITTKFYVGLNAAYGFYNFKVSGADAAAIVTTYGSTKPGWGGVALYSNYAFSDVVGIGMRYEYFDDQNHVRYIGTKNTSYTLTAPVTLADGHLIIKPELRIDIAASTKAGEVKYYEDKSGNGTNSQQTFGAAFIYKY